MQYEGGEWFSFLDSLFVSDSCAGILDGDGNLMAPDGQVGTVGYGLAPPPENTEGPLSPEESAAQGTVPFHRTAPIMELENGARTGALSETEIQTLESAYGPPTVLDIPFWTRLRANIVVWAPIVIAVGVAVVFVGGGLRIVRRREARNGIQSKSVANPTIEPR